MAKERYQNPVIGDTVRLRMFMYNGNNLADVVSVDSVNIYVCDPAVACMDNPEGKVLVAQIDPEDVVHEDTGKYYVDVILQNPKFVLGRYTDEWVMTLTDNSSQQAIENRFEVYPQTWYSTPIPVVYDFSFDFQPNKIRKGSKQYIRIRVTPNVTKGSDLARYYENLAISGDVKVTIEQKCGECVPAEADLRTVVCEASVDYKEKCFGYYLLDTEELDCGVYAVWFTLELGGNKYISDKMNLLIFE